MLIKRSVIDSIGWFDRSMVRGGSDHDLARRVWQQGFKVWSASKAVVHHLIAPYRLSVEYFRWVSFRVGENFASIDNKQWGRGKTLLACVARIGQALLVNMPLLVWAYLSNDRTEFLGRKCLIWRAIAYTRCFFLRRSYSPRNAFLLHWRSGESGNPLQKVDGACQEYGSK